MSRKIRPNPRPPIELAPWDWIIQPLHAPNSSWHLHRGRAWLRAVGNACSPQWHSTIQPIHLRNLGLLFHFHLACSPSFCCWITFPTLAQATHPIGKLKHPSTQIFPAHSRLYRPHTVESPCSPTPPARVNRERALSHRSSPVFGSRPPPLERDPPGFHTKPHDPVQKLSIFFRDS